MRRAARTSRGPRPKASIENKRNLLAVRVSKERKDELEKTATRAGRSISGEAEMRIEQSFAAQALLPQALKLRYGPKLAGALLLMAEAMHAAGTYVQHHERKPEDQTSWFDDPRAYAQAEHACRKVLRSLRPEGEVPARDFPIGETMASRFVGDIKASDLAAVEEEIRSALQEISELLGSTVVQRIKIGGVE